MHTVKPPKTTSHKNDDDLSSQAHVYFLVGSIFCFKLCLLPRDDALYFQYIYYTDAGVTDVNKIFKRDNVGFIYEFGKEMIS